MYKGYTETIDYTLQWSFKSAWYNFGFPSVSHSPSKMNCFFLQSSNQPQCVEDSGIHQVI